MEVNGSEAESQLKIMSYSGVFEPKINTDDLNKD